MILSLISSYRSSLMGVATIMVLLFHFQANFGIAPIDCFSSIGYGGVDIFLFLSGFGLVNGYKGNAKHFYVRRFARLYPTYLICAFLTFWQKGDFNPVNPLIASTGIGYFLPGFHIPAIEWYVPTMYLLYVFFPWFMSWSCRTGGNKFTKSVATAIIVGLLLTAVLIVIQKGTIILSTSRIPIFFIGVYFGHLFKHKVIINPFIIRTLMVLSIVFLIVQMYIVSIFDVIFLWRNAIFFLPFALIVPGFCILLSEVFSKCSNWISYCFAFVGKLSLEVYLVHVLLLNYWKKYLYDWTLSNLTISFIAFFLLVLLCSFVLSNIISPISKYVCKYAK